MEKHFLGKRSLTGAMVKGSSCQNPRRGCGEKKLLLPAFVMQYEFAFVNSSLINEA
jgi:hypothetical protein